MTAFEHGIYAWSGHGLEGRSRYQMTAATPLLRRAILQRHPLGTAAAEHSGWTAAADDPSARLLGWRIDSRGMFVWLKRRLPADHWAARGGHLVHFFHSTRPANLATVCSLIADDYLESREDTAARSDALAPIPRGLRLAPATGDEAVVDVAEVLVGIALSRNGRAAAAVSTTSDTFIRALLLCASNCPLPVFTRRNLSSSERPDRAGGNAIVGVGPSPGLMRRALDVPVVTVRDLPTSTRTAANVAVSNRSISAAAIRQASAGRTFDTKLFEALVSFLGGRAESVSVATVARVLDNPDAFDVAADNEGLRLVLVARVARDFSTLGPTFIDVAAHHPASRTLLSDFVDAVLSTRVPPGLARAAQRHDEFRRWLFAELAQRAARYQRALTGVEPPEAAQILSFLEPRTGPPTDARELLIRAIVEGRGGSAAIVVISPVDAGDVLSRWWTARNLEAFSDGITRAPRQTVKEAARLPTIRDDAAALQRWSLLPGSLHREAADKLAWGVASTAPRGSAGLIWALRRVAQRYDNDDAAALLLSRATPSGYSSVDAPEHAALTEDINDFIERRVRIRLSQRNSLEATRAEFGLLRVTSTSSPAGRQLFQAAEFARIMSHQGRRGVLAESAQSWLEMMADHSTLRPVAACLFLDGAARSRAKPEDFAMIVGMTAKAARIAPADMWHTVVDVFEAHTYGPARWFVRTSLCRDSLNEAAKQGQFGLGRRGLGPPRALAERAERVLAPHQEARHPRGGTARPGAI